MPLCLALDDAWPPGVLGLPGLELRDWGARVRFVARRRDVRALWRLVEPAADAFTLYGSGDFHFLSGLLALRASPEPFTLVSFDNHPDWDVRPPYWSCGGWAARVARVPRVERVEVWGCGNFELRLPARLFGDTGAVSLHAWAERQPATVRRRFACMTRTDWRDRFRAFATAAGPRVYVSVDLDCLDEHAAVTNWESGLFAPADVAWAIRTLREHAHLVGGDVCGAYSTPRYAFPLQRLAGTFDHPRRPEPDTAAARATNVAALEEIWPALTG